MGVTGQLPSVGRIVHYRLSAEDCVKIRYQQTRVIGGDRGNHVTEGDVCAALVVRVNGADSVNLQVFLDGPDVYWATSRPEHEEESGCWFWPPRVG
jgi:hypothetical protein